MPKKANRKKRFSEISPLTYCLALWKEKWKKALRDVLSRPRFAAERGEPLPVLIFAHSSLMRRRLAKVNQELQENKVVNLNLAAPKVSGIRIRPGEVFSFWRLVGSCPADLGYKEGLTISDGILSQEVGGGMCQFTNLLHWMALHTPLDIVEYHHHDGYDLFPDFERKVPFGTGTSIFYKHLDYRLQNNTDQTFQIIVYTTDEYLCGEIRAERELPVFYEVVAREDHFVREGDEIYRVGQVFRRCIDRKTGELLREVRIKENHAKVLYEIPEEQQRLIVERREP